MSLGVDVASVVQWLSPNGTPRIRAEHVVVTVELFAGVSGGAQSHEEPNALWAMLQTNKELETLKRIQYVFHDLFCPFSPSKSEKVRVLYALLYGDTERALLCTEDHFWRS